MSWRKFFLLWLAWFPYVSVVIIAAMAGVVVISRAVQEAPAFTLGALIFAVWLAWGAFYIHRDTTRRDS